MKRALLILIILFSIGIVPAFAQGGSELPLGAELDMPSVTSWDNIYPHCQVLGIKDDETNAYFYTEETEYFVEELNPNLGLQPSFVGDWITFTRAGFWDSDKIVFSVLDGVPYTLAVGMPDGQLFVFWENCRVYNGADIPESLPTDELEPWFEFNRVVQGVTVEVAYFVGRQMTNTEVLAVAQNGEGYSDNLVLGPSDSVLGDFFYTDEGLENIIGYANLNTENPRLIPFIDHYSVPLNQEIYSMTFIDDGGDWAFYVVRSVIINRGGSLWVFYFPAEPSDPFVE